MNLVIKIFSKTVNPWLDLHQCAVQSAIISFILKHCMEKCPKKKKNGATQAQ